MADPTPTLGGWPPHHPWWYQYVHPGGPWSGHQHPHFPPNPCYPPNPAEPALFILVEARRPSR
jgi:hypothetical protein